MVFRYVSVVLHDALNLPMFLPAQAIVGLTRQSVCWTHTFISPEWRDWVKRLELFKMLPLIRPSQPSSTCGAATSVGLARRIKCVLTTHFHTQTNISCWAGSNILSYSRCHHFPRFPATRNMKGGDKCRVGTTQKVCVDHTLCSPRMAQLEQSSWVTQDVAASFVISIDLVISTRPHRAVNGTNSRDFLAKRKVYHRPGDFTWQA